MTPVERAEARVRHLEQAMREILQFLNVGQFDRAWKLADYETRRASESNGLGEEK